MTTDTERTLKSLWTVWCWIEGFGGTINETMIVLNDAMDLRRTHPFRGKDYLQEAAEWVESRRKLIERGA